MRYWRKPLDADEIEVPRGDIHIVESQCKGCGFCVEYCPRDVLELASGYNLKGYHPAVVVNEAECVNCQLCEIICPEFSIFVRLKNNQPVCATDIDLRKGVDIIES